MTSYIAIDIGGTNIRAARYTPGGELLARTRYPTPTHEGNGAVMERLIAAVNDVMPPTPDVKAIGVGAPGPLDPFTGVVLRAPNLPGWVNFPLRDKIASHFKIPTAIGNDANMAAMGEWRFGAGRGHNDVLYLTISTGIGGGVISGGRLVVGARGLATELGHITVAPDGPVCGCGQRGHLEALASGPAIGLTARTRLHAGARSKVLELVNGHIESVTAQHVGEGALAGDAFAIELLAEAGTYIGRAIADFLHAFNPSIVILGGGVAINVGELLFGPVRAAMRQRWMGEVYDCEVVPAQLGDDVGLLGTLALVMETFP
ncbi:MAG: ROK family protein [Chloroflexota bacterium]